MRKLKSIYNDIFHVETGIGYFNTYADFRAFESYHCHSYVMGHNNKSGKRPYGGTSPGAPSFSDWVIPNYFEEGDFDFSPNDKEDYFVYLGRMHRWTKGTEIAMQVSEKCNLPLLMAGPDEPDGYFKKTKLPKGIETKPTKLMFRILDQGALQEDSKKDKVEIFKVPSGERKIENALNLLNKALYNINNKNFVKNKMSCLYCEFNKTKYCP